MTLSWEAPLPAEVNEAAVQEEWDSCAGAMEMG